MIKIFNIQKFFLIFVVFSLLLSSSISKECIQNTSLGNGADQQSVEVTKEILNAPIWSPKDSAPPIDSSKAYRLAIDWVDTNFPSLHRVEVMQIRLVRHKCHYDDSAWYYNIEVRAIINNETSTEVSRKLLVFMNGKVIGPKYF
ncbi:MAG: hypothetical protein ACR2PU_03225 [Gammaproteobacteria bacterium]